MFPIELIGDFVVVRPDSIQEYRVLLPDWKKSLSGRVVALGPEVKEILRGDRVSFGAAVGMDATLGGEEIRILKEENLDFIYEA